MKDILSLNLKFKTVNSDQLYYGQYEYSASFYLPECWVFRYTLERSEIDSRLTQQQDWRERMRNRWPNDRVARYHTDITDASRMAIHLMAEFIRTISTPYKLVIENRTMRIYTSDISVLEELALLGYIDLLRFARVHLDRAPGTIRLKNPQNNWRSYFKETRISSEDKQALAQFLSSQPEVRVGPGLKAWLDETRPIYAGKYTRDYFFVDYNHPGWTTMLSLVRPGLIRETLQIIAK